MRRDLNLNQDLKEICKDIRCDIMTTIGHLGVGHIGGCLSLAELLTVLYFGEMNIDPQNPKMPGRDRLVCSKGHAGPAVYAALANRGYFDRAELLTLNQGGTHLPSHCDMLLTTGIDMTTGSLGQGFSCAVGAALGAKLARDGARVYTLVGDGECQEGQIWEAAMFAAAKKLDNLIGFVDANRLQIDGTVEEVNRVEPLTDKWAAFGWRVIDVPRGNDVEAVSAAVKQAQANLGSGQPTMVILRTVKGCGMKWAEDLGAANHNTAVPREEAEAALRALREEA
jgi:transketolase